MNSVEIYDDFLNQEQINNIRNMFSFDKSVMDDLPRFNMQKNMAINIKNHMDDFPNLNKAKTIALCKDSNIGEIAISHLIKIVKYEEDNNENMIWEPHHDGTESKIITLFFIDIDDNGWQGGELDIYDSLDIFEYPKNKTRIEPKVGRLVVFNSSMVHCIRPYFGSKPRMTVSVGWE